MTMIITQGSTLQSTAPSPEPQGYVLHDFDWCYPEDSTQEESLMHEALTCYGQPIACSVIDRGVVFIAHGNDILCIREQIQTIPNPECIVFLNETDIRLDAANYPIHQPMIASGPGRTIPDYPRLDTYYQLTDATTTAVDIGFHLVESETSNFFNETLGALQTKPESRDLAPTATRLLDRETDTLPIASAEPLAAVPTHTPDIIEINYKQRIDQLELIAEDEDIPVSGKSHDDFWLFIRKYRSSPQAGLILTDEGHLVAIWSDTNGGTVEVEFLGDKQCKLIVFNDPKNPLHVLPEINRGTLASIGEQIGGLPFLHLDQ